jgi:hypothetical protein
MSFEEWRTGLQYKPGEGFPSTRALAWAAWQAAKAEQAAEVAQLRTELGETETQLAETQAERDTLRQQITAKDEALRLTRERAVNSDSVWHSEACMALPEDQYAADCLHIQCEVLRVIDAALDTAPTSRKPKHQARREARGKRTMKEMAAEFGVDLETYSRYEQGLIKLEGR